MKPVLIILVVASLGCSYRSARIKRNSVVADWRVTEQIDLAAWHGFKVVNRLDSTHWVLTNGKIIRRVEFPSFFGQVYGPGSIISIRDSLK